VSKIQDLPISMRQIVSLLKLALHMASVAFLIFWRSLATLKTFQNISKKN
jgi:hypothetical protein